jgi:phosphatidylglycerophosphate synthase
MEIIDMIDGPFARWLDNADGIGKVIDPIADKGKKFLVLYFLFLDPVLVSWAIIGLLSLGEIAVFILIGDAVCMAFKFEYLYLQAELKFKWWPGWMNCVEIYKNAKKEIFKNWHVVQDGKITMVYYAVMFGVIFLRSIWMTMGVFVALYWILAIIGFCLRLSSYLDYRKKFLDWQNKASARATQGRLI